MAAKRRSSRKSTRKGSRRAAGKPRASAHRRPAARRAPRSRPAPRRKAAARSRAPAAKPGSAAAPGPKPAAAAAGARTTAPAARPAARSVDFLGWLRQQGVKIDIKRHAEAFTAQEVAAAVKVTGYELAKVVVLKGDGDYVLAVVPAPLKVDLKAARDILGTKKVSLAHEEEFESLFPGCDRGAMPPFGNLWGVRTFVDESLARHPHIVFNAGSHIETVSMSYTDFERLARPTRARIAEPPAP